MTDSLYLSRSFVDFGPFKPSEVMDFIKRGIIVPSDYIRQELTTDWMTITDYLEMLNKPVVTKAKPKAKPKAKTAAKKKTAA